VWNHVFCGDPGAPAQSFSANSGLNRGHPALHDPGHLPGHPGGPYLYADSAGNYNVFAPSVRANSNGPSWSGANTAGVSLPLSTFYVVNAASSVATINAALAAGDNLLFTPGVYSYASSNQRHQGRHEDHRAGLRDPGPVRGTPPSASGRRGVNISGLILDAGPTTSPSLLQIGTAAPPPARRGPGQRGRRFAASAAATGRLGERRVHRTTATTR